MRLLYVCSDYGIPPDGTKGASIHLRAITRALTEQGHDVLLLSPREGPGPEHPCRRLLPAGCLDAELLQLRLKEWLVDRRFPAGIAQEVRSLVYQNVTLPAAMEALAGVKVDAVLERLSLFGHLGMDLSQRLGVPLVLEVNALLTEEAGKYRTLELDQLSRTIERRVLQDADAVLTVSGALARRLAEVGVAADRIRVVPNGVDLSAFAGSLPREHTRKQLGFEDAFVIGFVGSLKPWHGVDVLFEAFRDLLVKAPSSRLLIVGTGPMEARLRAEVAQHGLEGRVRLTGAVPHEQVPAMLSAMDVAVAPFLPMDDFYFSPIKLFEYMAAGLCVAASRIGQIAEVIREGESGLLTVPGDAGDLSAALLRVCADAQLRRRLGATARRGVQATFTWTRAAQQTLEAVHEAIARRGLQSSAAGAAGPVAEVCA